MKFIFSRYSISIVFKILVVFVALQSGCLTILAQTGPAGVGNSSSNKVWLDASYLTGLASGAKIGSWTDRSGNNWNANQGNATNRPSYLTNGLHGLPMIRFNRSSAYQFLQITNVGIGVIMSNSNTIFVISKANSGALNNSPNNVGNMQCVFVAEGHHSGILYHGSPSVLNLFMTNWTGGSVPGTPTTPTGFYSPASQGVWTMSTKVCIENGSNTTLNGYINGSLAGSDSRTLPMTNYNNNLAMLGATAASGNYAWPFNGDIAEVIVYNTNLNDAQRIIVDNYLAAKYNLTIANDYYLSHDVNYINDVQGIGTANASAKHIAAGNSKGLLLSEINNSLDAPNEFLFSGHASPANAVVTSGVSSGIKNRWARAWYLEKTGNIDAKLFFDFSEAGIVPDGDLNTDFANYKLLYSASPIGSFNLVQDDTNILIPSLENGDQLTFIVNNSLLTNGYYTIGYAPTLTWIGATSEEWNEASNWNLNRVPTSDDLVVVNACTTCPILSNAVNIAGLRLNSGSALNVGSHALSISGTAYVNETTIKSANGVIRSADFAEVKNSDFSGAVVLEKTGGNPNNCYGGNSFSPELKIINASEQQWQISSQGDNIIKTF